MMGDIKLQAPIFTNSCSMSTVNRFSLIEIAYCLHIKHKAWRSIDRMYIAFDTCNNQSCNGSHTIVPNSI